MVTWLRRTVLALALSAGLAPALAAPPPPVPALPDSERRIAYSLSGSNCACSIPFQLYQDSTDVDSWIEVWLGGVRYLSTDPTFGWTITSATGSLATIPRPITNGVLTFNNVQTGTVQIVSAQRPRRLSTFSENQGVAARDFNQALNGLTAQLRDNWDKTNDITGRGLFFAPGYTTGPMPSPTACANSLLGFGSTGLNPVCVTGNSINNVTTLNLFSGATGDVQLGNAISQGFHYVTMIQNATFANTTPINLPTQFVLDCGGYFISQAANVSPSLFTMSEGSQLRNCRLNGNGTLFTGDMIDITAGNNQRLINVDIVNTQGYNLNFAANVGGNFSWIGGSFNRTCSAALSISSGTYNSGTGLVTLTMANPVTFSASAPITIESLNGTGAYDSLRGPYTAVSASGTTVTYTAATGLGSAAIAGGFLLNCPNNINDAITFAASEAGTTGPRNFVDLNGNGSWGFNLNGAHFTSIEGGSMQCMDFNNNASYFFIHNTRIACHGNPNILGTNGFIFGTIFDAAVTLGSGATNIKIEQQPGFTNLDSSGNTTNQIIPAASNTYQFYMAGGNTTAWQIVQAGSVALEGGTDASNNPFIRTQNNLPFEIGICNGGTCNYYWHWLTGGVLAVLQESTPATPGSGTTNVFAASNGRLSDVDPSGNIGSTVQGLAAVSHKYLTSIVNGLPVAVQPSCGDLSDATFCNSSVAAALASLHYPLITFSGGTISLNTTNTDTAITISSPTTNYRVSALYLSACTGSITTATFGVFTATGGGGTQVVATTTGTVTGTTAGSANSLQSVNGSGTVFVNNATLQFRNINPQGSAVTCTAEIQIQPLP